MNSYSRFIIWSRNLASWMPPVLSVVALALAGVGQASLIGGTRFPRWLSAPYPFVVGLLLLILSSRRPQRGMASDLRRWFVPGVGLVLAFLCAVLAVRHFQRTGGFAAGLLLSALSIAITGAAVGPRTQLPLSQSWERGLGGEGHPYRAALRDGHKQVGLAEAILFVLAAAAMAVALLLWWRGKEPNLAFALNAVAFLCILWLALRLDREPGNRQSTDSARNSQFAIRNSQFAIRAEWLALAIILIAALFLRTHRLLEMPYGVWYDEGEAGLEAVKIYEGAPFSPMGHYSANNPSLFFYLAAVGFKLLGPELWTLRFVTAMIGVATVAAAYYLFRLMFDRRTAVIAAGLLAASSWHVNFSRIGMGYTTLVPFFETMTLYFLVRGLYHTTLPGNHITRSGGFSRRDHRTQPPEGSAPEVFGTHHRRWTNFVLAGLMLGLGMYSHTSFRLFPLVVVIFVLYSLIRQPQVRRRFTGLVLAGLVSLMVFAPLGVWAVKHPMAFFGRTAQTSFLVGHDTPQSALRALKSNVEKHALMFNVRGDRNGRHNLPGAPQLDAISAALFVLGVGYSLYRWPSPSYFLLVVWFVIAMLGGVLSLDWEAPQAARTIGAIPAVYGMAAVPLALAWQQVARMKTLKVLETFRVFMSSLAVGVLLLAVFRLNYGRYFEQQYRNPEVFHAFSTPDTAIARYIQAVGEDHYHFYLQNQFTPVYRFLTYRPGEEVVRQEDFFRAIDHLPVRGPITRDVMYVLEPWRVALPIEAFARYYPQGVYEEVADPFGKTMFYSYTVKQADVEAVAGLTGRYFAATDPGGDPDLTRRDLTVNFDWTVSSPLGEGPLSVRWEGTLFAPQSGTYALGTQSRGRSQVLLDGELVVDNPGSVESPQGWGEGVRSLAKGWHGLVVTCLDCRGGAMRLYWSPPVGEAGIVPAEALSIVPLAEHGLRGDYYAGTEPGDLPAFTQIDPVISFRWHDDPIPVPWNAQWSGWLDVEKPGEYQFQLFSNDQAALHLDGQAVLSGGGRLYGSARLDEGAHAIRVTYRNTQYYSELRLLWIPPGRSGWEPIPTGRLRPVNEATRQ